MKPANLPVAPSKWFITEELNPRDLVPSDYRPVLKRTSDNLISIMHYISHVWYPSTNRKFCKTYKKQPTHTVIVVDNKGNASMGLATCSKRDQYSRKYGFRLATKRALDKLESGDYWKNNLPVTNGDGSKINESILKHIIEGFLYTETSYLY